MNKEGTDKDLSAMVGYKANPAGDSTTWFLFKISLLFKDNPTACLATNQT